MPLSRIGLLIVNCRVIALEWLQRLRANLHIGCQTGPVPAYLARWNITRATKQLLFILPENAATKSQRIGEMTVNKTGGSDCYIEKFQ